MATKTTITHPLAHIQGRLKAPKGQYNNFGKYKYRSCEDILEAVKPLLEEVACTLTLSDEIQLIGERYYIKATATLKKEDGMVVGQAIGYAREAEKKSGMDDSQITGSASSYARKYALNGLFCIDDNKDADALNTSKEYTSKPAQEDPLKEAFLLIKQNIESAPSKQYLQDLHAQNVALHNYPLYKNAMNKRFKEVQ